jgi:asparagine synthase (glutamine-hydrolysing)
LSGGIDSSIVVALMQRSSTSPVRTFSIGNETAYYDESRAAEQVARHLGCQHTTLVVTANMAQAVIPQLADMFDEPFADSSQIPTYLVSQLARRDVTVALSGDGGDEVFGGYNRHVWAPKVWRGLRLVPKEVRRRVSGMLTQASPEQWDSTAKKFGFGAFVRRPGQQVHKLASTLGAHSFGHIYSKLSTFWPSDVVVGATADGPRFFLHPELEPVHQLMLADTLTYLPGDILTKVDRASMAVSLEARVPLLDHRVIEFAWRMPVESKVRRMTGKWALRTLLKRYVPTELVERPKMGFTVPVGEWLRGPLQPWATDLLFGQRSELQRFLNLAPIIQRWHEHLAGDRDWGHHLWIVLAFEEWRRRYAAVG